jgi:hypothetical protein
VYSSTPPSLTLQMEINFSTCLMSRILTVHQLQRTFHVWARAVLMLSCHQHLLLVIGQHLPYNSHPMFHICMVGGITSKKYGMHSSLSSILLTHMYIQNQVCFTGSQACPASCSWDLSAPLPCQSNSKNKVIGPLDCYSCSALTLMFQAKDGCPQDDRPSIRAQIA